jgi:hypothetical protein
VSYVQLLDHSSYFHCFYYCGLCPKLPLIDAGDTSGQIILFSADPLISPIIVGSSLNSDKG